VLRGGYFLDNAAEIRTSARSFATPAAAAPSVGIRCCKGP
jgi:formylglycine-generating enzyme required for sulfatase activity